MHHPYQQPKYGTYTVEVCTTNTGLSLTGKLIEQQTENDATNWSMTHLEDGTL